MRTKLLLLLLLANFSIYAQYTAIPDINFENKLISLAIDSGAPDGKILTANAAAVTSLDLRNSSISDLTGIEAFVMLNDLDCRKNQITAVNLSDNTKLTNLNFEGNKLSSLDLTANVLLESVDCAYNILSTINVTQNTKLTNLNVRTNNLINLDIRSNILLENLNCQGNQITSLDVSHNIKLTFLNVSGNKLTALNVDKNVLLEQLTATVNKLTYLNIDKNIALTFLNCGNNQLSALDVSKNINLVNLFCYDNKITSLNISKNTLLDFFMCNGNLLTTIDVSKNTVLSILDCGENKLTSIDISTNPKISELSCQNNQLIYLNLKSGNNTILDLTFSNFVNNPDLTCIQVDNATYSNTNWSTKKDVTATYNEICVSPFTLIPDVNFENKLISKGLDSGIPDGKVLTANIAFVKNLDIYNSSIKDLSGIEGFTALEVLNCGENQITNLDFSKNLKLKQLECYKNKLTSLNLTKNTALTYLDCFTNQLTILDLSQNKLLTIVYCYDNLLTSLNVTGLTVLADIDCPDNQLISLDVSTNTGLKALHCHRNKLKNLNLSKNLVLNSLVCYSNELTYLNLKNGNNTNFIVTQYTKFTNNPNLFCIEVDDVAYSEANWSAIKDVTASFSATCALGIEDSVFAKTIIYPNPTTNGEVNINNITLEKATIYNTLGQLVKSFTLNSSNTNNTINLSGLPKGVYYIYLINQNAASAKKIVIE